MTKRSASREPSRGLLALFRSGTLVPVALVGGLGAYLGVSLAAPAELDATSTTQASQDADRDGLPDIQEFIQGTNPGLADSDGDGIGDLEEYARGSDPTSAVSLPDNAATGIRLYARVENGQVTIGSAIFDQYRRPASIVYGFGIVVDGQQVSAPLGAFLRATISRFYGVRQGGAVYLLETTFSESVVKTLGNFSLYASVEDPASGDTNFGTVNLVDAGGVLMSVESLDGSSGGPKGLIYRPLIPPAAAPKGSATGQMCFQTSTTVGRAGASLVQEVHSAECEPSDGFCMASSCSAAVGTTVQVADPGSLIGG